MKKNLIAAIVVAMLSTSAIAGNEILVNEFIKAGFTQLASDLVKPPRVAEGYARQRQATGHPLPANLLSRLMLDSLPGFTACLRTARGK